MAMFVFRRLRYPSTQAEWSNDVTMPRGTVWAGVLLWTLASAGCDGVAAPVDAGLLDAGLTDAPATQDQGVVQDLDKPMDADSPPDADMDLGAADDGPPVVSEECAALVTGKPAALSELTIDGVKRQFWLGSPAGLAPQDGPWPVVFLWHGFVGVAFSEQGDTHAFDFHAFLATHVADVRMPFLLVTPLADGVAFLDWNILDTPSGDGNPDVRLFDEVLACLDARFGVDPDRVHSLGFSAGAIMTNLLGMTRGERIASLLTWSGAYLANPANDTGDFSVYWPEVGPSRGYVQLVFRGGVNDVWEALTLRADFDTWTRNDIPWLNGLGHDVIDCPHQWGHMPPRPYETLHDYVISFFRDHPRGVTESPWALGMPDSLPVACTHHAGTR